MSCCTVVEETVLPQLQIVEKIAATCGQSRRHARWCATTGAVGVGVALKTGGVYPQFQLIDKVLTVAVGRGIMAVVTPFFGLCPSGR